MNKIQAEIGSWYSLAVGGQLFEVVAIDETANTIETQFVDGEIGEFEQESWRELTLERAEPPEDWRHPFEISEEDYPDPSEAIVPTQSIDILAALEATEPLYCAEEEEEEESALQDTA